MKSKKISIMSDHNIISEPYVPERFYKAIALHIVKNYYADKYHDFKTPLILAISGPPGMGKTYQTEYVLESMGIEKFKISGAEFENENAGVPIKNIQSSYRKIADDIYDKKIPFGSIIIDDIDAAIGKWDGIVQYTMNRQLLLKALIDFADNPYNVKTIDEDNNIQYYSTNRVPIIVTLNDETKMYEPLMRNGRTTVFPWIPNEEEITNVLDKIFEGILLNASPYYLYNRLLDYANSNLHLNVETLPISLFSDIRSSLYDEYLWQQICVSESFNTIVKNFNNLINSKATYDFSEVYTIGQRLLHKNKNYLNL